MQITLCWLISTALAADPSPAGEPRPQLQPRSAEHEILLNEAIDSFADDDLREAETLLQKILAGAPDDAEARYYLALVLLRRGEADRALAEFDRAALAAPELSKPSLERGLALLSAGKEADAVANLEKVVESAPDNGLAHLMLGVAFFRAEKRSSAEKHLVQAKQLDAELSGYADIYLGLVAAERGQMKQARDFFARGATLAPGSELGQRAFTLVEQLEGLGDMEAPKPWDVQFRIGLNFDDNVILQGHKTDLPRRIGRKDDFRVGTNLDFHYRPLVTKRFRLTVGGSTFHSWHANVGDFNLQVYAGNAQGDLLIGDRTQIGLRYDYEYSLLGNRPLLSRNQITPQITHSWTDWTSTTGFYQYAHGNFLTQVPDWRVNLDFDRQSVGVVQTFAAELFERSVLLNVGYRFDNESTAGNDYDKKAHTLSAGVSAELPWKFVFDVSAEWSWERYKRPNTIDFLGDRRTDRLQTYVFALTRPLSRHVSIRGEIDLIFDDSNVLTRGFEAPFSYDRAIYGVSLICKF